MIIEPVGFIHTDFKDKFGIPRQSGLVPGLKGKIVFEGRFKDPAAFRGIEEFTHLWIIWGFSQAEYDNKTLTVHPPRLGGKIKRGVFATRSPFRPNSLGLSSVKLEEVVEEAGEISLIVSGVDMLDGTPVYDVKPYVPFSDVRSDAIGGFSDEHKDDCIEVLISEELLGLIPEDKREALKGVLSQDPRAAYNKQDGAVYGLSFAGMDIRFTAKENRITVTGIIPAEKAVYNRIK